ncbi:hypothetical protein A5320_20590 [Rheinheimera sp. SA_1]|jgi:outer membrane protein OmpA-like peptidoglycan-associated protein|uniref:OmpA family protein n=1 Tax=Rheinheimera sp. SA_1 TaxID=1827365 RepID=UPI0007FBD0D6|nr:OmpA family protein [Rheinheimera sp. SA_1]OBP17249.1 hypothetical protein A5320_20590 [Rheinheimera sp. SA_1]
MNSNHLLVAALTTTLTLGGCASIENNNTNRGAAIGAVVGAVAGKATGNHKNKRLAIGAAIGALTGAAVGRYMDNQEQALREQLSGTGVKVYRDGDILRLDIPAQVTFAVGRSDIRADLYPVLNDIAKVLSEYEKTMLVITGHTDDTGPMALNMQLSQGRADSVKQYLIAQQVNPIRLETRGVGPNYPAVPNTNEANRAANRRVEIHIEPVTQ